MVAVSNMAFNADISYTMVAVSNMALKADILYTMVAVSNMGFKADYLYTMVAVYKMALKIVVGAVVDSQVVFMKSLVPTSELGVMQADGGVYVARGWV
jgi:hypothetical protein